jgi:hypothetical protein
MSENYLDDDENVKMMRETARRIGLTPLLCEMRWSLSPLSSDANAERFGRALDLLGATDDEVEK